MSILRRLRPRRRATGRITMGVHVVAVPKPIALAEREPGPDDLHYGCCWRGHWCNLGFWIWRWAGQSPFPSVTPTHWLPASVDVLPARCCAPEVE